MSTVLNFVRHKETTTHKAIKKSMQNFQQYVLSSL